MAKVIRWTDPWSSMISPDGTRFGLVSQATQSQDVRHPEIRHPARPGPPSLPTQPWPGSTVANAASKIVAIDQVEDQPGADGVRDIDRFTHFMRFLAPLRRTTTSPRGEQTFHTIGCAVCHKPDYPTLSSIPALDGQVISAYSDFLLHDVGTGDGIEQGSAPANKLRTAPLMGLVHLQGLLHDGSARSLNEAILAHSVEAAGARQKYINLSLEERRNLEEFLQSL